MSDISKITLPSGNTYDIKDSVAREAIAGGVSFVVAWDGNSTPVVADIPSGVKVIYNETEYTGTLSAETTGTGTHAQPGAFYLVKSSTQPSGEPKDLYDEYVPVGTEGSKFWEKLGDTHIDLTDVVTDVTLNKATDTAIGTDATLSVTQPTVALAAESASGSGRAEYVQSVDASKKLSASASGANVAWNSKDAVSAVTGYSNPTTASAASSVSPTTQKLETTSITGVSGSTTASKATAATSQTTADGSTTASTTNTDILKGMSVSNEVLTFGAATLDTQTTTQQTFSDVTVPTAASATTVATGGTASSDASGADVVTNVSVGETISAITALGTPTTDSVIGADSTFTVTQPSVTVASGSTGDVAYVSSGTTKYMSATATGGTTEWDSKDSVTVLTNGTNVNVTKGQ